VETIPAFPLRDGERGLSLPASFGLFEPSERGFDDCGDPDKDETVGFGGTDCGTRSFVRRPFRPGLRVSFSTFSGSPTRPKRFPVGLSQRDVPSLIAASRGGDACGFFGSVDGDRLFLGFVGVATIFSLKILDPTRVGVLDIPPVNNVADRTGQVGAGGHDRLLLGVL